MKKSNMKSINKQTKSMLITYAMVIAVFIIVEIMISTGMMSSLMQGLLVPLCIYSIVAIGLNLCVGYLGELSLGHAGFMCVGAFSSAVFSKCMMATGMNETLRFILAILIGKVVAAIKTGKVKTTFLMFGIVLTMCYNLPFELFNLNVAGFLLILATIFSIISGVQYYVMNKDIIFETDSKNKEIKEK